MLVHEPLCGCSLPPCGREHPSSRTVRRCAAAENACKLSGTEMPSGALLVAVCRATGDELVNYNRDSPFPDNPYRVRSDR